MLQNSDIDRKFIKEKILNILKNNNGIKARKIAALLGVEKKLVNSILYSELKNECIKDENYYWYIKCQTNNYDSNSQGMDGEEKNTIIGKYGNIPIEDKIIELLFYNPGSRAYEIARNVGVEKSIVNSVLYNKLKGICIKLDNYYWYLSKKWCKENNEKVNELKEKYQKEKVEAEDQILEKIEDIEDPIEILKWLEENGC